MRPGWTPVTKLSKLSSKRNRINAQYYLSLHRASPKQHFGKAQTNGSISTRHSGSEGGRIRRPLELAKGGKGPKGESQIKFLRTKLKTEQHNNPKKNVLEIQFGKPPLDRKPPLDLMK